MARLARLWMEAGKPTGFDGSPGDLSAKVLESLANRGDPMAMHVFGEAGRAIGQILSAVFNLLSLEMAVFGGGGSGAFEHLKGPILEVLAAHLVTAQISEIKVVKGLLGVTAPLVGGAALLAAEGF
jgi:predicted NBD/HSP70 family sugar kinase